MTKPVKLAAGIGLAGSVCAALAVALPVGPPWRGLAAWTALSCGMAAAAYTWNRPGVFGKRDGRLVWWRTLPTLPYLVAFWIGCACIRAWRGLSPYDRVAPGLYVGGRVEADALPRDVALVVDLTCEYAEPASLRRHPGYRSLPVLDGHVPPDEDALLALLAEMDAAAPAGVYVHCESGVGRAPTAAALLLMRRGVADDPDSAIELVRKGRPRANPTLSDRRFMARVAPRLR
jgi:protein-tyrosine phosphatase